MLKTLFCFKTDNSLIIFTTFFFASSLREFNLVVYFYQIVIFPTTSLLKKKKKVHIYFLHNLIKKKYKFDCSFILFLSIDSTNSTK